MDKSEYLEPRSVSEFIAWVMNCNRTRSPQQSREYREQRNGLWKKYADEAEPLAVFLNSNGSIPRRAEVKMGIVPEEPDATVRWDNLTVGFEITTTDHPGLAANRLMLNERGFGDGETTRVKTDKDYAVLRAQGRSYTTTGVVKNHLVLLHEELERIKDRLEKKQNKIYPQGTFLIVDSRSSSLRDLREGEVEVAFAGLREFSSKAAFAQIWLCLADDRVFRLR